SPQFAEVASDIVTKLTDAISHERVRTQITWSQAQQTRCRDKRNSVFSHAIKAGDDSDTLPAHRHELMFRDLDARLFGEGERKNFARSNVPSVVGLGKFRDGQSVVSKADRCFWPSAANR